MTAPAPLELEHRRPIPVRRAVASALFAALLVGGLAWEVVRTAPVRRSLKLYNDLIAVADAGDLDAVRGLCTSRYLRAHPPKLAPEGGLMGLPHYGPHKNFRIWRRGGQVLLCPTDRDRPGPVYRFVEESGTWRFDGPAGLLTLDGRVVDYSDSADDANAPQ